MLLLRRLYRRLPQATALPVPASFSSDTQPPRPRLLLRHRLRCCRVRHRIFCRRLFRPHCCRVRLPHHHPSLIATTVLNATNL